MPTVPDRAQCNFCSTEISYKGKSTNNLLRHLRTKHADLGAVPAGDNSEIVESKIESCVAEDGSTYYVLSAPVNAPSPAHSHSSFQAEVSYLRYDRLLRGLRVNTNSVSRRMIQQRI